VEKTNLKMSKQRLIKIFLTSLIGVLTDFKVSSFFKKGLFAFVLFAVCLGALFPGLSHAFSFGKLEMKSGFGEKFRANVILKTDNSKKLSVSVGSHTDYARLQISRHEAVDYLRVASIKDLGNGKKNIVITSDKPLFYPSFYLAVKVAQNGGTIIEKFLIAADFQKNISIGSNAKKNPPKTKQEPSKKPVRALQPPKKVLKVKKKKRYIEIPPAPLVTLANPSLPETIIKDLKPRSISKFETAKSPEIEAEPEPETVALLDTQLKQGFADPISQDDIEEIPIKETQQEKNPKKVIAQEVVTEKVAPQIVVPKKMPLEPYFYGPLTQGETLFSISKALDLPFKTTAQTAASIWLENSDQFILGNIHGIKKGAILNLGGVESSARKISVKSARLILNNHWSEWEMIRDMPSTPKNSRPFNTTLVAWPPIMEAAPKEEIFSLMKHWREARTKNNTDKLLSFYSSQFKGHNWQGQEMPLNEWKNQPTFNPIQSNRQKPKFFNAQLTQIGDRYFISVYEWVSEKLEHRAIEWKREGNNWKIVGEIFFESDEQNPDWETSFVVHVSSHPYIAAAWREVNLWRKRGFNAYISRIDSLKNRTLFRVFVERFSNWKTATEFAKNLRSWDKGSNAIPSRKPFSMSVGIFQNIQGAREKIKFLQNNGISGYVLPYCENSEFKPSYHVLVGGFATPLEAQPMANLLKDLKVGFRLVKL